VAAAVPASNINGFNYTSRYMGNTIESGAVRLQSSGSAIIVTNTAGGNMTLTPNDMTVFNNGLVGAILGEASDNLTPANTGVPGLSGQVRVTEAVMVGGKAANLEHVNFGFWERRMSGQASAPGVNINSVESTYQPFILESQNALRKAPTEAATFNGTVLANAYDRSDNLNSRTVSLVGQASLTVNLNALTPTNPGNLIFVFDNFYTLRADLSVNKTSGYFSDASTFAMSNPEKNTTGITLSGGSTSRSINGYFYGVGAGQPTEAAGTFSYSESGGTRGVSGAFGVKR
jgi:hypothetical protein